MAERIDAPILISTGAQVGGTIIINWKFAYTEELPFKTSIYKWNKETGSFKWLADAYQSTTSKTLTNILPGNHTFKLKGVYSDGTETNFSEPFTIYMPGDVYLVQPTNLFNIANAVRNVTGLTDNLTLSQISEEINGLSKITHGTIDLEEGVSELTPGVYYFYESSE